MMNIRVHPHNASLKDAGYSFNEEKVVYSMQLLDILENTAEYLESLDKLKTYKVRWKNYKNTYPTLPYEFVKEKKQ